MGGDLLIKIEKLRTGQPRCPVYHLDCRVLFNYRLRPSCPFGVNSDVAVSTVILCYPSAPGGAEKIAHFCGASFNQLAISGGENFLNINGGIKYRAVCKFFRKHLGGVGIGLIELKNIDSDI